MPSAPPDQVRSTKAPDRPRAPAVAPVLVRDSSQCVTHRLIHADDFLLLEIARDPAER
jgi:hypothetical protein